MDILRSDVWPVFRSSRRGGGDPLSIVEARSQWPDVVVQKCTLPGWQGTFINPDSINITAFAPHLDAFFSQPKTLQHRADIISGEINSLYFGPDAGYYYDLTEGPSFKVPLPANGYTYSSYEDLQNKYNWDNYVDTYDPTGKLDTQYGSYDNGSHWFIDWDQDQEHAWKTVTTYVTSGSVFDYRVTENDDGTRIIEDNDNGHAYNWSLKATYHAAGGGAEHQNGTYDDGRTWSTDWDTDGIYDWVSHTIVYNSSGGRVSEYGLYDDGNQWFTVWDNSSSQPWSTITTYTDAQNRFDYRVTVNDDGTKIVYEEDQLNQYAWANRTGYWTSDGVLYYQMGINDDREAWSMSFFTLAELDSIRNDPSSIATLYANERDRFIAQLSPEFAGLPDDYIKLAFTAVFSYELTPYGNGVWTNDLQTLLHQSTAQCRNYCDVAWQLYNLLPTSGTADVTLVGYNGGYLNSHAELLINIPGQQTLLVDPTVARIAITDGYNDLTAGVPIPTEHQQSFFWRQDAGLPQFDQAVETALTDGYFRGGNLMYWYEVPQYLSRYAGTLWNPNPQREQVLEGSNSNNHGLGSLTLPNQQVGTANADWLFGGTASDHLQGGSGNDVIFGGTAVFTGSNFDSHGVQLRSGNFFTNVELAQIQSDPNNISALYAQDRVSFVAALGPSFASLPDQEIQLAFAALLTNELKSFDSNAANVYTLSDLMSASALNTDGYALLAWRLFQILSPDTNWNSPAGNPDVVQIGWNGGAIGREAQLLINVPGEPSLLVDPTIAHFALIDGFNQLVAGEAVPIADQSSFLTQAGLTDERNEVITALHDGLYRTGDLLYWFEIPNDMAFFFQSPNSPSTQFYQYPESGGPQSWSTPQGEVVRAGFKSASTIGTVASHDEIIGGPGADVLFGDGIVNNDGVWTPANAGNYPWFIGDFNGDGKDDIFRYVPGHSGADMFLSTGSGFASVGSWTGAGFGTDGWYIGDFNGDGKDDILRYMPGTSGAQVFLSTGSSFTQAGSWTQADHGVSKWYVGDFNGDGKDDIFRYVPGHSGADMFLSTGSGFVSVGSWTGAGYGTDGWYLGDFNGDGKTDLMRYMPGQAGAEVFLSTGHSFAYAGSWTGYGHGDLEWFVQDVNGDGKDDLLGNPYGSPAGSVVLLSTGSSFEITTDWSPLGKGTENWRVGDFNGDGKADLLVDGLTAGGTSVLLGAGVGQHDADRFVFSPGDLNGDTIVDFQGATVPGGDELWFQGFGSASDLSLTNVPDALGNPTDHWTLINGATGHSETFAILGIEHLSRGDYFFV